MYLTRFSFWNFQLLVMALITMSVFLRTEMHHDSIVDGGIYTGALFFSVIMVMFNGLSELSLTTIKLPNFYKQRDLLFYPSWVYSLPNWILKIPITFIEVALWVGITYYGIGFDPNIERLANTKVFCFCSLFCSFLLMCEYDQWEQKMLQVFQTILGAFTSKSNGFCSIPIHRCIVSEYGRCKHGRFFCTSYPLCPRRFCPVSRYDTAAHIKRNC